eukprot:TRINITY_DN431_c0_g1_i5.p1 TRINITY_DN431_c0_g1~~TRINITY_DN431_c0_g1_i5.p1  ORF type:complete len:769 (+),score=165.60 TRINITY_DN431_c0_g1_i5:61-2367(+)
MKQQLEYLRAGTIVAVVAEKGYWLAEVRSGGLGKTPNIRWLVQATTKANCLQYEWCVGSDLLLRSCLLASNVTFNRRDRTLSTQEHNRLLGLRTSASVATVAPCSEEASETEHETKPTPTPTPINPVYTPPAKQGTLIVNTEGDASLRKQGTLIVNTQEERGSSLHRKRGRKSTKIIKETDSVSKPPVELDTLIVNEDDDEDILKRKKSQKAAEIQKTSGSDDEAPPKRIKTLKVTEDEGDDDDIPLKRRKSHKNRVKRETSTPDEDEDEIPPKRRKSHKNQAKRDTSTPDEDEDDAPPKRKVKEKQQGSTVKESRAVSEEVISKRKRNRKDKGTQETSEDEAPPKRKPTSKQNKEKELPNEDEPPKRRKSLQGNTLTPDEVPPKRRIAVKTNLVLKKVKVEDEEEAPVQTKGQQEEAPQKVQAAEVITVSSCSTPVTPPPPPPPRPAAMTQESCDTVMVDGMGGKRSTHGVKASVLPSQTMTQTMSNSQTQEEPVFPMQPRTPLTEQTLGKTDCTMSRDSKAKVSSFLDQLPSPEGVVVELFNDELEKEDSLLMQDPVDPPSRVPPSEAGGRKANQIWIRGGHNAGIVNKAVQKLGNCAGWVEGVEVGKGYGVVSVRNDLDVGGLLRVREVVAMGVAVIGNDENLEVPCRRPLNEAYGKGEKCNALGNTIFIEGLEMPVDQLLNLLSTLSSLPPLHYVVCNPRPAPRSAHIITFTEPYPSNTVPLVRKLFSHHSCWPVTTRKKRSQALKPPELRVGDIYTGPVAPCT